MQLTNAARQLKQKKVPFTYHTYEVNENDLSADHVARSLAVPIERLYKTICLRDDRNRHAFFLIAGHLEINLKDAAKAWGVKKVAPIAVKELETLTGYVRGGVSPIGAKKPFPVFIHDAAQTLETMIISAGKRGFQIELAPNDLLRFTNGRWFNQT